jgi:hypothetical protein
LDVWKSETAVPIIQEIREKERFIPRIKNLIHHLQNKEGHTTNPIFKQIFKEYIERISFLMEDIFEARFKKILNNTQKEEPINEDHLFAFEVEYYKSINLGFRGYSIAKKFVLNPEQKSLGQFFKTDPNVLSNIENEMEKIQTENSEYDSEETESIEEPNEELVLEDELEKIMQEEYEAMQQSDIPFEQEIVEPVLNESSILNEDEMNQHIENDVHITSEIPNNQDINRLHDSIDNVDNQKENIESTKKFLEKQLDYVLIRILGDVPELVGEDLRIYGPFKNQEVVNLPKNNAEIIISERKAEKLNPII